MRTTLPERSLELWAAAYLVHALPDITLWAPTQRATPNFDMSADANGKLFLFEFKAAYLGAGEHVVKIDMAQLARYLSHPILKACTYYLLPSPPYATTAAIGGYLPGVARARQGDSLMGWQPVEWWAWAIPATTLGSVLSGSSGTRQVACAQIANQFGPSALPLAQFVTALQDCTAGVRVEGGVVQDIHIDDVGKRSRFLRERVGTPTPGIAALVPFATRASGN
jgi:hypothetical protein